MVKAARLLRQAGVDARTANTHYITSAIDPAPQHGSFVYGAGEEQGLHPAACVCSLLPRPALLLFAEGSQASSPPPPEEPDR